MELFIIRKCPSLAWISSQHEVRALTLQTQACMKFVLLSQIVLRCTTKHLDLTHARSRAFKMACCHCETTLSLRWSALRRSLRNVVILTLLDLKSYHCLSVSYISGSVRHSRQQRLTVSRLGVDNDLRCNNCILYITTLKLQLTTDKTTSFIQLLT